MAKVRWKILPWRSVQMAAGISSTEMPRISIDGFSV